MEWEEWEEGMEFWFGNSIVWKPLPIKDRSYTRLMLYHFLNSLQEIIGGILVGAQRVSAPTRGIGKSQKIIVFQKWYYTKSVLAKPDNASG
jgi:hypothetical protein